MASVFLIRFPSYFLRQDLSLNRELVDLASLAVLGQSLSTSVTVVSTSSGVFFFKCGYWAKTQIFRLAQQAVQQLSQFPSPYCSVQLNWLLSILSLLKKVTPAALWHPTAIFHGIIFLWVQSHLYCLKVDKIFPINTLKTSQWLLSDKYTFYTHTRTHVHVHVHAISFIYNFKTTTERNYRTLLLMGIF